MKVFTFILFFVPFLSFAQESPENAVKKLGQNPIYIIDSNKVLQSDLAKYNSDSITSVEILYDSTAVKLFGSNAKDGAVIIETRAFARQKFIKFFRQVSLPFDSLYSAVGNDQDFQYILNEKIQKGNFEGNLSMINKELFINIEIINDDELKSRYQVFNKKYGINVKAKKPGNLYKADEKF